MSLASSLALALPAPRPFRGFDEFASPPPQPPRVGRGGGAAETLPDAAEALAIARRCAALLAEFPEE